MERSTEDRFDWKQIDTKLTELGKNSGWAFNPEKNWIEKTFTRKNFLDAIEFMGKIAEIAEANDHHPDLYLHGYKHVDVMLTTHSAEGVTQNDFDLASAIEHIA